MAGQYPNLKGKTCAVVGEWDTASIQWRNQVASDHETSVTEYSVDGRWKDDALIG